MIGEKIREIRCLRGLSQKQLAEKSGYTQTAISHFELGKRDLTLSALETIAKVLNVNVQDFFETNEKTKKLDVLIDGRKVFSFLIW